MSSICPVCGGKLSSGIFAGQCMTCLLELARETRKGTGAPHASSGPLPGDFIPGTHLRRFGDYELIDEIARGGMGVVYRARQVTLGREVALKMILAGQLATPEAVARFDLEARAAARLAHPNIVPIYEVGEHDTLRYYSMKLVEGGSLANAISELKLGTRAGRSREFDDRQRHIAELMIKLAEAISYAHSHGILHRDLKPNNVLMDLSGEPLLSDFGLAKFDESPDGLTRSQAILGSPSHMAPEQAQGRTANVTTAVDIYGLGALLYELMSGRPPFRGETALITLRRVLEEEPEPVLRSVPDVDQDLATICHRCLEKQPSARYPSAAAVAAELRRFLQGKPIEARPIGKAERLRRWSKRRPAVAALAVLAALTMLVGLTGVLWQWRRAESANAALEGSLRHAEWLSIQQFLDARESSRAVALLARRIRANPHDTAAARLAMSVLEQRRFSIPLSPAVTHGPGVAIYHMDLHRSGEIVATSGSDGRGVLWSVRRSASNPSTTSPVAEFNLVANLPSLAHQAEVHWIEFSPTRDHDWVATASDDGTARVWQVADAAPVTPPLPHDGPVQFARFDPTANVLATATAKGELKVWDPSTGRQLGPSRQHTGGISLLAFSPDGLWLATGGRGGVWLWNALDPQHGPKLKLATNTQILSFAFTPDSQKLATASSEEEAICLWNLADGSKVYSRKLESGYPMRVAFSSDGTRLAATGTGLQGRLWDVASGAAVGETLQHLYSVIGAEFSPAGDSLITFSWDQTARLWDSATGRPLGEPLIHSEPVLAARLDSKPTGHLFTLAGPWDPSGRVGTTRLQLWSLRPPIDQALHFDSGETTAAIAFSPEGSRLAVSDFSGRAWVLQSQTAGIVAGPFPFSSGHVRGLGWSPDGTRLIYAMREGTAGVWDVARNRCITGPTHVLPALTEIGWISPDGSTLLAGGNRGEVALWDTSSGLTRMLASGHSKALNGASFSRDGLRVATCAADGTVGVWDTATGRSQLFFQAHGDEVASVQFHPNGRTLATASYDGTVRLWDAATGKSTLPVLRHQAEAVLAEFSPEGNRLITAARDGTTRIWDIQTGRPLTPPMRHRSSMRGACFSPDGLRVATEDHDGLRVWDATTGDPLTLTLPQTTIPGIGFRAQGLSLSFSPDGSQLAQGTASKRFSLFTVGIPSTPVPIRFVELLEAVAGNAIEPDGVTRFLGPEAILKARAWAATADPRDFYTRWAGAYFELDPPGQKRSAASADSPPKQTVP